MIKELEKHKKFSVAFVIIIAVEILLVSSIPGSPIGAGIDFSILYHFLAFFLFNFFLLIAIKGNERKMDKIFVLTLIIALIYAVLDEMHQFFVPLRTPDILDFLVDSAGIFLSALVYGYYPSKN